MNCLSNEFRLFRRMKTDLEGQNFGTVEKPLNMLAQQLASIVGYWKTRSQNNKYDK